MLTALSLVSCAGSGDVEGTRGSAAPTPPSVRIGLEEPCPDGVTLALGAPFRGRDYAKFQTAGGTVYVSVRQFVAGETEDREAGEAVVYVGPLARPPTYVRQSGDVRGTLVTATVAETTWSSMDLAEGRYWLTVANGWDVFIRSCEPAGLASAADF